MTVRLILVHHYFNLFSISSWLSEIIRRKQKQKYPNQPDLYEFNHIEWLNSQYGVKEVVGGISKGFIARSWDRWITERPMYFKIIEVHMTREQVQGLMRDKGMKYDFKATFFWHLLHWITGKWYGPKGIAATCTGNCSEIIATRLLMPNAYMATTADIIYFLNHGGNVN